MGKVQIGRQYRTAGGQLVSITGERRWPGFALFLGDNGMDYDEDGLASFALMFKGRFRSPGNDLVLEMEPNKGVVS